MRKATEKLARTCNILANFKLSHRLAVKEKTQSKLQKEISSWSRKKEKKIKNIEYLHDLLRMFAVETNDLDPPTSRREQTIHNPERDTM